MHQGLRPERCLKRVVLYYLPVSLGMFVSSDVAALRSLLAPVTQPLGIEYCSAQQRRWRRMPDRQGAAYVGGVEKTGC